MTIRKYSFVLANSSHMYIWELYVFAKYGNFVLNIQNFWKNSSDISEWVSKKKQLIFEEKSHLSKFKPNSGASSCHNMGTIHKKISWQA